MRRHDAAILWVEHHLVDAAQYASRILLLEDGTIVEHATTGYTIEFGCPGDGHEILTTPTLHILPEAVAARLSNGHRTAELIIRVQERA